MLTGAWRIRRTAGFRRHLTVDGDYLEHYIELEQVAYEPHLVSFDSNDQKSREFLSLNPNGKIPAILDPQGPGGKPLALFESGAILIYLADKSGSFIPPDPAGRYQAIRWHLRDREWIMWLLRRRRFGGHQ
jgi:GST-like protein